MTLRATTLPGLAPRSIRLVAALVDAFFAVSLLLVTMVAGVACLGASALALGGKREWLDRAGTALTGVVGWVVFLGGLVALLCLTLYQWYLLSTRGQTIGKAMVGIRIVSLDGQPAGFFQALLLRVWVFSGLLSLAVSVSSAVIPVAGVVLALLDYVPLFGDDRRCLHDYVAGTQVRWVRIAEVYVGRLAAAVLGVALVGGGAFVAVKRETVVPVLRSTFRQPRLVATAPPTPPEAAPGRPPSAATIEPGEPDPSLRPSLPAPTITTAVIVPKAPPRPPEAPAAAPAPTLFQFTDSRGVVHVTDDLAAVPERYRSAVTNP